MIVRADEHISTAIVEIICNRALSEDWALSSVAGVGQSGSSDVSWITDFAKNAGGQSILTADTDFLHKPPQVVAIYDTGLKVIHLPPKWATAKGHMQLAHLLQWWKRIEATLMKMNKRECYEVPWNINDQGCLKRKEIMSLQKAQKKIKRSLNK